MLEQIFPRVSKHIKIKIEVMAQIVSIFSSGVAWSHTLDNVFMKFKITKRGNIDI